MENQVNSLVPATAVPAPKMTSSPILSATTGKQTGTRWDFTGNFGAKQVKEQLKGTGLKGAKLSAAVNKVLCGEVNLRNQLAAAFLQHAIQEGFTADFGKLGKKSGSLNFVKVVNDGKDDEIAALKVELAELKAGLLAPAQKA